jgi:hypothetical protein
MSRRRLLQIELVGVVVLALIAGWVLFGQDALNEQADDSLYTGHGYLEWLVPEVVAVLRDGGVTGLGNMHTIGVNGTRYLFCTAGRTESGQLILVADVTAEDCRRRAD